MNDERKLIKFKASTGFSVVLEFINDEEKTAYENKIKNAGLECETIKNFNLILNFCRNAKNIKMQQIQKK